MFINSDGQRYAVNEQLVVPIDIYLPVVLRYVSLPDLIVQDIKVELETGGSCNYTSTRLGLRVTVANVGEANAGSFVVDANGSQMTIPGLAAGSSTSVWIPNYQFAENTGVVDATSLVAESNEQNNMLTQILPIPTPPPPCTPTPTPTGTPMPTATPTPTPTMTPQGNADVVISYIFYDGVVPRVESDEYAEITNNGTASQNLQGWRLNAGDPGQDFIFPSFELAPGQFCRVYTNEHHPEHCGFSFGSGSALWRNSGDCGYLYDGSSALVDDYCY